MSDIKSPRSPSGVGARDAVPPRATATGMTGRFERPAAQQLRELQAVGREDDGQLGTPRRPQGLMDPPGVAMERLLLLWDELDDLWSMLVHQVGRLGTSR